ncbi:hypothetical protein [Chryseobacterium taklimakanense]|uniref:hypothetical protein n=1 Tax=Chryseobacterium taklimakanense TaxID=536441 RepID=UPI0012FE5BBF|nr:hypothetical protein [Chryseobacterium taklimakanense]
MCTYNPTASLGLHAPRIAAVTPQCSRGTQWSGETRSMSGKPEMCAQNIVDKWLSN